MAYPTTDEEFNERAYAGAGLQPSTGEREQIPLEGARQFGSAATRVTSISLRKGGGLKRSGGKVMRTGAVLSRTGAGAVAGVPMMATSAAMRSVGGAATEGKKLLRASGVKDLSKSIKGTISATRVNITVLSFATPIWFSLQLPLALMAIVALGLAGAGEGVAETLMKGRFTAIIYGIYDAATNVIEAVSGVNLNVIESWTGFSNALFSGLTMLVFFIGIFTLGFMAAMYILSGVHCFMGKHAVIKSGTFIFALLGYLMPVLNILPWFILWGIVVWRYPK
ncbi:MAG: hypothetical protein AAB618_00540 [Patescibacteria group bacterium]